MTERDGALFDETLLSGYLDGELTQADAQRVRLRLEDDAEARRLYEELETIRAAARSTQLAVPADDAWSEAPASRHSRWLRRSGWMVIVGWVTVVLALGAWALWTSPESWQEKLIVVAAVGGPTLLFLSILSDRLRRRRTDRYTRVKK